MHDQNQAHAVAVQFNVADFEAVDTAWLEVENKKGDGPLLFNGQPVRIEVRSPGTREAMLAQHAIETANTAKTYAAMRGKMPKDTVEDKIAQGAKKLVAITASIENFPISANDLYENPRLGYIAEQVSKFHGDWGSF
jgi:hypothetical protein